MKPYQKRVIEERSELVAKLNALLAMTSSPAFPTKVPDEIERRRMLTQANYMAAYVDVLDERIAAFPPDTHPIAEALNVRFSSDAGDDLTVREYFHALLTKVWNEEAGFSGKRPWGNSGWCHDVITALVCAGFIEGVVNRDGDSEWVDLTRAQTDAANDYVFQLIDLIFNVKS